MSQTQSNINTSLVLDYSTPKTTQTYNGQCSFGKHNPEFNPNKPLAYIEEDLDDDIDYELEPEYT
jgi:hypothetical protein